MKSIHVRLAIATAQQLPFIKRGIHRCNVRHVTINSNGNGFQDKDSGLPVFAHSGMYVEGGFKD